MKFTYRRDKNKITQRDLQVVFDYKAGISIKDICKKYGFTRGNLYRVLKKEVTKE